MKKIAIISLIISLFVPLFGAAKQKIIRKLDRNPKEMPRAIEPSYANIFGPNHQFGPITSYSNRDSEWTSTLIDSSLNGYGGFISNTNPIAYSIDEGYVIAYRQFQGLNATAGYIGSSQSEDGEEWFTEQKLNARYPTGEEDPSLPTATGTPQGRYPSAGFAAGGSPTAIWNEYTNADHGGGQYGGYPLYTYDSQGIGEFSTWVNPFHMNNGCATTPCEPADLWNGTSYVNNGGGTPRLTSIYEGWSDTPRKNYWISSNFHANGYFLLNDPYVIADDGQLDDEDNLLFLDGYTAGPDYHINDDGVGYMVQTAYASEYETSAPVNHTMFFKKTEDYGETWTSDGGYKNSGYGYISDPVMNRITDSLYTMWSTNTEEYPDMLWYPGADCQEEDEYGDLLFDENGDPVMYECGDSVYYSNVAGPLILTPGLFLFYDYDVKTDNDGGIHFVGVGVPQVCLDTLGGCDDNNNTGMPDSLNNWPYTSAGHYLFYNPDPLDQPNNWTLTYLNDYYDTYNADWDVSDIPYANAADYGPWYYMYPQITFSGEEDSQVMWYAAFEGPEGSFSYNADSTEYLPSDIDIFLSKSNDLGRTWTDLENVTNTPGGIFPNKQLETSVHLANIGTDESIGVFYQMPDLYTETYPPAVGYEDYMNRVYVGIYSNDTEGENVALDNNNLTPKGFSLKQNYPNPFNPVTQISYELAVEANVTMDLFDLRGKKIKTLVNTIQGVGNHSYIFDASEFASGVYLYSMTSNGITQTRKLVLMK